MADELSVHDEIIARQREETDRARTVPEWKPVQTLEQRIAALEARVTALETALT